MSELIKLYRQDGSVVNVNQNSLEHALSIGWSKKDPAEKPVKKPVKSKSQSKK